MQTLVTVSFYLLPLLLFAGCLLPRTPLHLPTRPGTTVK